MLFGEVEKNVNERIRVERTEFNGHDLIAIRIYFRSSDGQWLPTKKGITVSVDTLIELMPVLEKAMKDIEQKGDR